MKKIGVVFVYLSILILFWLNAEWLLEWLNRSLFADFRMFEMEHDASFYRGASFIFLFMLLFYALFGNVWTTLLITNGLFLAVAYANQIKVMTRNEYITYKEMLTLASPKEILLLIDISMKKALVIGLGILFVLFLVQWGGMALNRKLHLRLNRWLRVAVGSVSFFALFFIFSNPHSYNQHVLQYEPLVGNNFNPVHSSRNKGYLPTVIHTMNVTYMDRPNGYSKGTIEQLVEKYCKKAETINATRTKSLKDAQTIFYLSETLMTPSQIKGFETGEPIMPHLMALMDHVTAGNMYTQYIGGGTANIEWSVLTSFSLESFNDNFSVTPYSDFYTTVPNHYSILSFFTDGKVAIHPYTAGLYKRKSVFEKVGFDSFLYIDHGLKYTERFEGHDYINDASMHKEIMDELDNGAKMIHALSMQNHSNYHYTYPFLAYVPDFWREPFGERAEEVENFLKGLRVTDEELPELIDAIEQSPNEVNLLLYGDHLPNMFRKVDDFSKEELHRTPWFLYMNQGRNESQTIHEISPIFFTSVLLSEGDYYVSPFQVILTELYEAGVQRIGKDYIVQQDVMRKSDEWDEEIDILFNDYHLIMYDALLGSNYATALFFEEWK